MKAETRLVTCVCAAEILGLARFSLAPALLPQFIAGLVTEQHRGWLVAGSVASIFLSRDLVRERALQ